MPDYFALLEEPRRPWIEEDSLKAKFLQLSAQVHPDRLHGASTLEKEKGRERYTEINSAYQCLREPKSRLRHLIELESGVKVKEIQQINPQTMELCMEVGRLCSQADAFLAQRARMASPLLKVEWFGQAQEWTGRLTELRATLGAKQQALTDELKRLNTAWEGAPGPGPLRASALPLQELEMVWRDFSYLGRWTAQLQERLVQLSF